MYSKNPLVEEGLVNEFLLTGTTLGLKAYNENTMCDKIIASYPNPADLKQKLMSTGSPKAIAVAMRIQPDWTPSVYRRYVMHTLCGRTFLRYLGNWLGMPFSTIYQGVKAINNGSRTGEEIVDSRV